MRNQNAEEDEDQNSSATWSVSDSQSRSGSQMDDVKVGENNEPVKDMRYVGPLTEG